MSSTIPVNIPLLGSRDRELVLQAIESGWVSSEGPFVKEFETKLASKVGRKHGIAVCNGTAALELAVQALGLNPGDEVILPTFTIMSCALAVVRAGLVPIFVDADPETWNMDCSQVESLITPRTRALMPVHIYGLPCDMTKIQEIAKRHGLRILEDAAEAHGLDFDGKPCGSFGDLSVFSFYPNKLITTGEGGMVLTNDDELAKRCRRLSNLGFGEGFNRYHHDELGWNYRMTNLQAALGVAQLESWAHRVQKKREIGRFYQEAFQNEKKVQLPVAETLHAKSVYWVYGLLLRDDIRSDAVDVMSALSQVGVGTRPFFHPLHRQPALKPWMNRNQRSFPVAERLARRGFYIPSGLGMSKADLEQVASRVIHVLKELS